MFNFVECTMVMNKLDTREQYYDERKADTMSFLGTLSPASSSVDSDLQLNSPMSATSMSPSHMAYHSNLMMVDNVLEAPYMEILEEPVEKFRFRYKSEMVGTHGSLTGINSDKIRKSTYPTVHLHNFDDPAIIRCSLVQIKSDEPHAHRLVIKAGSGEKDDPHDIEVSPERGFTAVFQGMGIIHTAKKYLKSELSKKKIRLFKDELIRNQIYRKLTQLEEAELDRQADAESKTINLNTVRLKFEAFHVTDNMLLPICRPLYSHGINNLKSALTGELKIVRMDYTCISCIGGQEIFILVEKVTKNNIKVRFFECDEDDNEIWYDYGKFSHIDVHHQYAIVFKAPAYRDQNIDRTVKVFIQLERPSDGARSEPRVFKYKPTDKVGRKRTRYSESLSSNELPATINNLSFGSSISLPEDFVTQDPDFFNRIENANSAEFADFFNAVGPEYKNFTMQDNLATDGPSSESSYTTKSLDPESSRVAKKVVSALQACLKDTPPPPPETIERLVYKLFNDLLTRDGNNALHTSILCEQYRHLQYMLVLLSKMKHLQIANIQNSHGETSLHLAVKINNPTVVNLLLPVGSDANIVDFKGNTPLHIAVYNNLNLDEFKDLIERTDVNKENDDGSTPLHVAISRNNLKSVITLITANANVNAKHASNGNTALHMAVEEKCSEIVSFLLQNTNVRLDAENYSKTTPVHMAKLLAADGDASELILQTIETYVTENGLDHLMIKSEQEDDDTSSESEVIHIKSEPNSPNPMEIEDQMSLFENLVFTEEAIIKLSKILDNTDVLIKLAKELDFDSICSTSMLKISTKMLLNYANVTGINVFKVRQLLLSYGMREAVKTIDGLYL